MEEEVPRILLIADCVNPRPKEYSAALQTLQEHDYDVTDPRIIEDWEKGRLHYADVFEWMKRIIRKSMNCTDAIVIEGFSDNIFESQVYEILDICPWINSIKFLNEWID